MKRYTIDISPQELVDYILRKPDDARFKLGDPIFEVRSEEMSPGGGEVIPEVYERAYNNCEPLCQFAEDYIYEWSRDPERRDSFPREFMMDPTRVDACVTYPEQNSGERGRIPDYNIRTGFSAVAVYTGRLGEEPIASLRFLIADDGGPVAFWELFDQEFYTQFMYFDAATCERFKTYGDLKRIMLPEYIEGHRKES